VPTAAVRKPLVLNALLQDIHPASHIIHSLFKSNLYPKSILFVEIKKTVK